jgi:prephenate dehydrogenase
MNNNRANNTENKPPFASVLIIGLGMVGGSIAAALKALPYAPVVRGIDVNRSSIDSALAQGILDQGSVVPSAEIDVWLSEQSVELIILATPVDITEQWLEKIKLAGYCGAITDVASTKAALASFAKDTLHYPERYIPGHPMAGSEVNGIDGANANLFKGAHWILCPDDQSDPQAFTRLHEFVTCLGARCISIDRNEHDNIIAIVSHVPHIVASALVQLASAHAQNNQEIFRLAAGGFKDTTRIAAGSAELWSGIALDNQSAVVQGLAELKQIITGFEDSIAQSNATDLIQLLNSSAVLRRSIPQVWVPDSSCLTEMRIPMSNHAGAIAQVTSLAGKVGCNIQSIDIDHINEDTAILELILTDEGNIERLVQLLQEHGFEVELRPVVSAE